VRQRLHERCVHCEDWVEEVSQADAVRFRNEPEERAVAIEAPRAALFDHFQSWFVVTIEDFFGHPTCGRAIDEREGIGTVPLHAHDSDYCVRKETSDGGIRLKIFEFQIAATVLRSCASRVNGPRKLSSKKFPHMCTLLQQNLRKSRGRCSSMPPRLNSK
jgi:hypothetical protein